MVGFPLCSRSCLSWTKWKS